MDALSCLMCAFPHVFVISLTVETVLFETRIGCEELPTMMFQQIVFSCREEARITRCHKQFSTTTFLLGSENHAARQKTSPKIVATQLQDAAAYPKTVENSVWPEDCHASTCSDAQLLMVRTMPLRPLLKKKTAKQLLTCLCVVVPDAV